MRRGNRWIVVMAAAGIGLLGCLAAGIFLKSNSARETWTAAAGENIKISPEQGREEESEAWTQKAENINPEVTEGADPNAGAAAEETGAEGQSEAAGEGGGSGTESEQSLKPLVSREEETGPRPSSDIVMLFAGDVYFSDHVLNAYDSGGGIQGVLDEGIRAEIQAADIFMVNQEFPFTVRGTPAIDKQFTFRVPESRIHILQEMGVDIVTLANNHILDFGPDGLLDSCEALDAAGILRVGGGKDFDEASQLKTMIVGQKTIGFLGTSRVYMDTSWAAGDSHPGVFSTYDTTLPLKAIREARDACDYLVVYVHWGVEREETPKDYQRAMGRAYIDAGADLVVGSHPHVLQPVEEYNGKTIVYSLGNFVFGSSIPNTALLKVVWGDNGADVSLIPCTSSGGYTKLKN